MCELLVIEDDQSIQELYKELFPDHNVCVSNKSEDIFEKGYFFDIIISDYSVLKNETKQKLTEGYVTNLVFVTSYNERIDEGLSKQYVWLQKGEFNKIMEFIKLRAKLIEEQTEKIKNDTVRKILRV